MIRLVVAIHTLKYIEVNFFTYKEHLPRIVIVETQLNFTAATVVVMKTSFYCRAIKEVD